MLLTFLFWFDLIVLFQFFFTFVCGCMTICTWPFQSHSRSPPEPQSPPTSPHNYETTFDVDGNVETVSTSSLGNKEDTRSQRSVTSAGGSQGNRYPYITPFENTKLALIHLFFYFNVSSTGSALGRGTKFYLNSLSNKIEPRG